MDKLKLIRWTDLDKHFMRSCRSQSFPVVGLYSLRSWTLGRTRQLGAYIDNPGSRVPGEKRVQQIYSFDNCD